VGKDNFCIISWKNRPKSKEVVLSVEENKGKRGGGGKKKKDG